MISWTPLTILGRDDLISLEDNQLVSTSTIFFSMGLQLFHILSGVGHFDDCFLMSTPEIGNRRKNSITIVQLTLDIELRL